MCVHRDEGLGALENRQVEPASPRRPATSLAALRSRFSRDEAGAVGMVFALMSIPCVMLVGFAVDFSRVLAVRQQTQGMLDNAALAGAKATQGVAGNLDTLAQAAAANFWSSHKGQIKNAIAGAESVTYSSNGAKTELTWTVTQWVQTPFLQAGSLIDPLVTKQAQAGAPAACAANGWQCQKISVTSTSLVQAGGNTKNTNIETAVMLDITGSMAGQKLVDLKLAAKDLIDIVVWNDQSVVKSRVAVLPFSQRVNIGSYATAVTGMAATSGSNKLITCVTERTGNDQYTDAAPGPNKWIGQFSPGGTNYNSSGACGNSDPSASEQIIPLSKDKTILKDRIDQLTDGGATAGHLGTAWAWYALSPKWSSIWPTDAQPEGYDKIATGKLRKIAILMTDGDYNTQYSNTSSQGQAAQLCTNMKAAGTDIEVFTIGFQVSNAAKTFLTSCATNSAHYYDATTGDALRMAFRDIALKISSIRLQK